MRRIILAILSISLISASTFAQKKTGSASDTLSSGKKEIKLTGQFESKQGVMNEISCYCNACGYLIIGNGERIALCFDEIKPSPKLKNEKITVKGYYKTLKRENDNQSPCPGGQMQFLMVKEFKLNLVKKK